MTETKQKALTAADRCDRCNAQAFIHAKGMNGSLYFCAHHFTKWEESIRSFAFELIDDRDTID
jgi:hypothetical protein